MKDCFKQLWDTENVTWWTFHTARLYSWSLNSRVHYRTFRSRKWHAMNSELRNVTIRMLERGWNNSNFTTTNYLQPCSKAHTTLKRECNWALTSDTINCSNAGHNVNETRILQTYYSHAKSQYLPHERFGWKQANLLSRCPVICNTAGILILHVYEITRTRPFIIIIPFIYQSTY